MARSRTRFVDAPPRNDVYVGMLGLAVFAMIIGCLVLAIESDEYDWSSEAKAGPALNLPAAVVPTVAPKGDTPATPPAGDPPMPMTPMGTSSKATPKTATEPAPAVATNPPAPKPAAPTSVAAQPPVVPSENAATKTDTGPRPGFNLNLPRK